MEKTDFAIIGAGLAGCECALVLAAHGFRVSLYEQKPHYRSAAHVSDGVAELVCSNSFRSSERTSGIGLLKNEMRRLGSFFMRAADACRVPAGNALAVDRDRFSAFMQELVESQPNIRLVRRRVDSFDESDIRNNGQAGIILAPGPLVSDGLAACISDVTGDGNLYFYDAIAPVVWTESIDMDIAFRASRYGGGEAVSADYINCPMTREEYEIFYAALMEGETCKVHDAEKHFEGCMPIEALAARGPRTLLFGPLKPVGLINPATGVRPWAVLQLRPEKLNMETCNLVGCQTKLLQKEQARIFRLVPGMKNAEFVRYGSLHRNSYLNAPEVLNPDLSLRGRKGIYVAGQLAGVEGYVESAASALWLALFLAGKTGRGNVISRPPVTTALGALLAHIAQKVKHFQPSNAHFGLMPELPEKARKRERREKYADRAENDFSKWLRENGLGEPGESM